METSQESAADHLTRSCTMNTGDDDKTTGSAQLEDDMKYGDISSDQLACLGGWPRLILSFATYDRDVRHLSLMRTKTQEEFSSSPSYDTGIVSVISIRPRR
eukprot:gnl/TRDRNA2_/TRDRNA2_174100_c0_seq28.p1 gnl/TRDRNA2_/TRDRNA2_174100_c0~~gnl/TRDRNA2_/TRDRNA2_174100_c0_seq28.p1  ORF type:complete len:101 (-),score=13.09 gnl/TRDRNA2_/TRDRNA2_174100_c0_seq28:144-446(-)